MHPEASPDVYGPFRNAGDTVPPARSAHPSASSSLLKYSGALSALPPEPRKVINEESQWSVNYNIH